MSYTSIPISDSDLLLMQQLSYRVPATQAGNCWIAGSQVLSTSLPPIIVSTWGVNPSRWMLSPFSQIERSF